MNTSPPPNPLDSRCQCPECQNIIPLSHATKVQAISVYFFACTCGVCIILATTPDASLIPPAIGHDGMTTIGLLLDQKVHKVLVPGTRIAPGVKTR